MRLLAYAKLNLLLRVLRRREDGYHDLLSLMQTVSLADRITLAPAKAEGIHLSCSDPFLPCDSRNLAYRAAERFYDHWGDAPSITLHLEKHIPMQAGLGGGSSDAAAVLNGLNRGHGDPLPPSALQRLAAELGSDVPFFLRGGCAVAEGRGERLAVKSPLPLLHIALICPDFGVETAWAYRHATPDDTLSPALLSTLDPDSLDWQTLIPHLENDLERGVLPSHPEIGVLKRWLLDHGADFSMMTGSGSAVFGLFSTAEAATIAVQEWHASAGSGTRQGYRAFGLHSVEAGVEIEEGHAAL